MNSVTDNSGRIETFQENHTTDISHSLHYDDFPSPFYTFVLLMFMEFIFADHTRQHIENYTDEVDVNCEKCMQSGKCILYSLNLE